MKKQVTSHLPDELRSELHDGCPALLLTIGEDGYSTAAFTWMVALNSTDIRFGADHDSTSLNNLIREGQASLEVITPANHVFLIKGQTSQVKSRIEATPFKMVMMEMALTEAKDQSTPGVNVHPLSYEWKPDQRQAMLAMEKAVYTEMREWDG